MIDVTAIPKRLEDRVVEPEHHNVLHCLLAEIVINAVNLILVQNTLDLAIQALGRFKLVSEWFLDDNAPPADILLVRQSRSAMLLNNRRDVLRCSSEITQVTSLWIVGRVHVA